MYNFHLALIVCFMLYGSHGRICNYLDPPVLCTLLDVQSCMPYLLCNQLKSLNSSLLACTVLRDPDSNPYSLLEGEGELADGDLGEGTGDRRRRSRRRRNDQEPSVMDAAAESDGQTGPNENGLGEAAQW